jgi:hypothetical protein
MATKQQIEANQQNSQKSTGPVSQAGLERSSKNATRHGFTGQSLVVTPAEKEAYEAHVAHYMAHHNPTDHKHKELVQESADLHWSIHQIFVEQSNVMNLMNAVHHHDAGDPLATAKAVASLARTLNTLSIYESRRRRAAKSVQEELAALEEAQAAKQRAEALAKSKQTKADPEIGFVHSAAPEKSEYTKYQDVTEALLCQMEAETDPIKIAELREIIAARL